MEFTRSSASHSANDRSSNCSIPQCVDASTSLNHSSCRLSTTPCFAYRTQQNEVHCAPGALCSFMQPCDSLTGLCSSNQSVCVHNSCCQPAAVCLPLWWTNFCLGFNDGQTTTTSGEDSNAFLSLFFYRERFHRSLRHQ